MPDHGSGGTLYGDGHNILTNDETVLSIQSVFAVMYSCSTIPFVEGIVYRPQGRTHHHLPIMEVTSTTTIVPTTQVLRKVILYPLGQGNFAFLDHLRPVPPISAEDIIVPCYLEAHDVVLVQGADEEWVTNVRSLNVASKTAEVQFLVCAEGGYVHESRYRRTTHTIHWNSVKKVLEGKWEGRHFLLDMSA